MAAERESDKMFEEFTAREPDSYPEAYRQREILRTSSEVNKLFTDAEQMLETGEIDKGAQRAIIRSGVERMIREIEHIAQTLGATDLLQSDEIYTVKLPPPGELVAVVQDSDYRVVGQPDLKPKVAGSVSGLWGFLNAPEYFSAEWTIQLDVRHGQQQPVTQVNEVRMPVEASEEAFRLIRQFMANVKLDLGPNLTPYTGEEGPGI